MKIHIPDETPTQTKRRPGCALWIATLVLCVILLVLTILFVALYAHSKHSKSTLKESLPKVSLSPLGKYENAAVATDNVYCSEIGRDILLKGGNAVDAAIAALFCIGVMGPQSSGLGGGHFMTIYNATTKSCSVVDAREVAPGSATEDMYVNNPDASTKGWKAIAVPGELHGYWMEYSNFGGGLPWANLVEPTIELLEEGIPTSHVLANALKEQEAWILNEKTMTDFVNPKTGTVYKAGEQMLPRKKFIETLRTVAASADPVQVLYNSNLTRQMAAEIQQNGGIITFDDFKNYRSKLHTGSNVIYTKLSRGRQICGPPPPAGSAVTQAIISILDGYYAEEKDSKDDSVLWLHRFIEASKFAYGDRSKLSDMAFDETALPLAKTITSASYAQEIRTKITDKAHPDSYYGGDFQTVMDHGTTHITVTDAQGNAVSVTSTINLLFGGGVVSSATGILFNDEMDDFSSPDHPNYFGYAPSKTNFIFPGKRPMSSASPIVVFNPNDPEDLLAIGTAGGSKIITGTAGVALRVLWLDENVKQAIDAVRVHNQLTPNIVNYEDDFPEAYKKELESKGHKMELAHNISVVTAVRRSSDGNVYANSDYRKGTESASAGF